MSDKDDAAKDKKPPSRLRAAFAKAFGRKAPWYVKVVRSAALVAAFYPALNFGLMPNLPGRGVTEGERVQVQAVFGDSLNADKVRIHSSRAMDFIVNPAASLTDTVVFAHTRGNVMMTNTSIYQPDFSKLPHFDPSHEAFLHECVHIWQHQNDPLRMAWATACQSFKRQGGLEGYYEYRLEKGKDLLDYSIEQQAVIITDYHLKVCKGEEPANCANTETGPALRALYEDTLKEFKANPRYIAQRGLK